MDNKFIIISFLSFFIYSGNLDAYTLYNKNPKTPVVFWGITASKESAKNFRKGIEDLKKVSTSVSSGAESFIEGLTGVPVSELVSNSEQLGRDIQRQTDTGMRTVKPGANWIELMGVEIARAVHNIPASAITPYGNYYKGGKQYIKTKNGKEIRAGHEGSWNAQEMFKNNPKLAEPWVIAFSIDPGTGVLTFLDMKQVSASDEVILGSDGKIKGKMNRSIQKFFMDRIKK